MSARVVVAGAFDVLGSRDVRFLQEASRLGELHVALWSDDLARALCGRAPRFPLEERRYMIEAVRYVAAVAVATRAPARGEIPLAGDIWAVGEGDETARARGVRCEVIGDARLEGFARIDSPAPTGSRTGVVVTGCYDWLHSGHVRFFEEVSALGDLTVVVGNDAAVRGLKGEGHPLFGAAERRYMVGSIRFVAQALVSSGVGWLDAEPEILRIRPGVYAVNEDGDKPEKRAFCEAHGIRYVVLERAPREGLARRSSTDLRGF